MHVALSESYPEFVRSGLVSVLSGRVIALRDSRDGDASARVRGADDEMIIEVSVLFEKFALHIIRIYFAMLLS